MLSRTVLDVWRNIQWFYHDKIHFLQLHCLYILLVMFIGSFAFYFQPGTNWSYIDALFMAATSVSNCGLSTITMSDLNTWHIVVIYLVSCLGSHIVISIIILYVRRHYFSKRFEDILIFNKAQRLREANKRKFEKNIQRNSDDSLRKRLSFMSTRSAQKVKDEEDDYASIPPENKALPIRFSYSGSDSKDINDNKEPMQNLASLPERSTIEAQPEAVVSRIIASHPVYMANSLGTKETDNAINSNRTKSRCYSGDSLLKQMNDNQVDSRLINSLDCKNPSSGQNSNLSNAIQLVEGNTEQINGENAQNVSASYGIAFAENIERQREVARLRLAQDRKFEDNSLYRSSLETDSTCATDAQYSLDPTIMTDSNVSDKEEMKRVMREPIRISELTKQQRYRLGGAEYRAIVFLTRLVPFYYLFYVIGFGFVIRIYVAVSSYAQQVLQTSNGNPVNPWLFSFFLSMSSFNNLGMSLINSSMVPFQSAPFLLLVNIVLILAGNTAYAIFLRVIIWTMYKLTPRTYVMKRETLRYLLDHPRRCYTTLFPATHTKWLLIVLIWITATEFVSFVGLNYWLPVLKQLDWGVRILDGLFQSAATRNAGYSVVDVSLLNPGTLIVFIIAMYISAYPVAISIRNSNVYQERALGIYSGENDNEPEPSSNNLVHRLKRHSTLTSIVTTSRRVLRKPDFFVMTQIQRQMTSEIGWVVCIVFLVSATEWEAIMSPSPITIVSVIYECVSAFGGVGASLGYPNTSASQSQQYRTLSKVFLIILMYRGRHRGLPAAIDRAVLLPSENLERKEQEDHLLRRKTASMSVNDETGRMVMTYNRCHTL